MSASYPLYTIGYAGFPIETFVAVLRSVGALTVCDVRSAPYSRHYPAFSSRALRARLTVDGLGYQFFGRELGARRPEAEAYTGDRVDFVKVRRLAIFRIGLERLREQLGDGPVVLMCAERDPILCHRLVLVVRALYLQDSGRGVTERGGAAGGVDRRSDGGEEAAGARRKRLEVRHLRRDGSAETQEQVEGRLMALHGARQAELFPGREDPLERAYRLQGEAIAFRRRR